MGKGHLAAGGAAIRRARSCPTSHSVCARSLLVVATFHHIIASDQSGLPLDRKTGNCDRARNLAWTSTLLNNAPAFHSPLHIHALLPGALGLWAAFGWYDDEAYRTVEGNFHVVLVDWRVWLAGLLLAWSILGKFFWVMILGKPDRGISSDATVIE